MMNTLFTFLLTAIGVLQKSPLPANTGYRLWPGDLVEIKFFYNPELNDTLQIRPDGRLMMPLVGEVEVSNRTVNEVSSSLEQMYARHLKAPAITIYVRSYGAQKVYVGGEVPRPGSVSLIGHLTMLEAIMEAGGIKHTGSNSVAILIRKRDDGTPIMREISLKNTNNEPSGASGLMLLPFDIVLVPESRVSKLDRWVDQHIRQLTPVVLTFGFSYLLNGGVVR